MRTWPEKKKVIMVEGGPQGPLTAPEGIRLMEIKEFFHDHKRAFILMGKMLLELRRGRLYRETHGTWEDFIKEEFDFHKAYADRMISGFTVAAQTGMIEATKEELSMLPLSRELSDQTENAAHGRHDNSQGTPIISTERQVRELARADPFDVPKIIEVIKEKFPDREPTAKEIATVRTEVEKSQQLPPAGSARKRVEELFAGEDFKQFDALRNKATALSTAIAKLATSEVGKHLGWKINEAAQHLRDVAEILKFSTPYSECVYCEAKGCKDCYNSGYLTETMFKAAPKSRQSDAQVRVA